MHLTLIFFTVFIFLYALLSERLSKTILTAPILFTCAGILLGITRGEASYPQSSINLFLVVAEIGLVMLLFTDACKTDLRILKRIRELPFRLLSVGMLLTLTLGAFIAKVIFPNLSWAEAGILSAILAPTDAGLGQVVVNDERVPLRIRQALNVEAGLNDGLSVPFLLFFIALESMSVGLGEGAFMEYIVHQLIIGTIVGVGVGLVGGYLLNIAEQRKWIAHSWRQLGTVALPVICIFLCEEFAASMFIAAFVAGLAVQYFYKDASKHSSEFTEQWGQIFNLFIFMLFGIIFQKDLPGFTFAHLLYAVLSLTIIRMLPVAISLYKSNLDKRTVAFIGWFGPRGLASIVLALVYLKEIPAPANLTIQHTVMLTIFISVIVHGVTAIPGIKLYCSKTT